MNAFEPRPVLRLRGTAWERLDDNVSRERAVRVILADADGAPLGERRLWAWPHDLAHLVLGHLLLDGPLPLLAWEVTPLNDRELVFTARPRPDGGPTGRLLRGEPPQNLCLDPQALLARMDAFLGLPGPWDDTGCFHRLALWRLVAPSETPKLARVAEDIGRHNCLDRLAGWLASRPQPEPAAGFGLLLSARVTASLYHKARRAGFTVLVSRSAVSSAAVDAAQAEGVTLVGFCRPREGRFTVFADPCGRLMPPAGVCA